MGSEHNGPLPTSRSSDDDNDVCYTIDTARAGQNWHFDKPIDANQSKTTVCMCGECLAIRS